MPENNKIYIFFGLIASGKSTVARAWAEKQITSYYNSDQVRKELAGIIPRTSCRESYTAGIYSAEFTRKTYEALCQRAKEDIMAAGSVVLDASYQKRSDRDRVRETARETGATTIFILCTCPEPELKRRMEMRLLDPGNISDGRWEIYVQQKKRFEPPEEDEADVFLLDTLGPLPEILVRLEKMMQKNLP